MQFHGGGGKRHSSRKRNRSSSTQTLKMAEPTDAAENSFFVREDGVEMGDDDEDVPHCSQIF